MRLVPRKGLIATTLAVGAVAAQSAQASAPPAAPPILPQVQRSEVSTINRAKAEEARALSYNLPRTARYSNVEMNAFARTLSPAADATRASDGPSSDFDYRDAGVGAGITAGVALLIVAGSIAMRRRSQPHYP